MPELDLLFTGLVSIAIGVIGTSLIQKRRSPDTTVTPQIQPDTPIAELQTDMAALKRQMEELEEYARRTLNKAGALYGHAKRRDARAGLITDEDGDVSPEQREAAEQWLEGQQDGEPAPLVPTANGHVRDPAQRTLGSVILKQGINPS